MEHVDNRFALVMRATRRARQLQHGADALVEVEDDKPTVVALREIAEGRITDDVLEAAEIVLEEEEADEAMEMPFGSLGDERADEPF